MSALDFLSVKQNKLLVLDDRKSMNKNKWYSQDQGQRYMAATGGTDPH